jgi:DNA-directed RNA polymerase specialized sigma24 family protein
MERPKAVYPEESVSLPPLPPAEVLLLAHSSVEATPVLNPVIAPFPASGIIFVPARSSGSGQPSDTTGRYDHLRQRYDEPLKRLVKLRRQLGHSIPVGETTPDDPSSDLDPPEITTYPTSLGILSFAELMERTRKYAAFVLRNTYQVNEADIDDGLQAGYMRLWQRLQKEPELLEDKALAWIGKGIIFTALHTTRGDWQFRQRTASDGEQQIETASRPAQPSFQAHSRETRQTDIRVDLHQAIRDVAESILTHEKGKREDQDLWALYGLTVLQVSASETSRLFGVREQSMQTAYKRVRSWLQAALSNYAPQEGTRPVRQRGRAALPSQDMATIRKTNGDVPDAIYEAVKSWIEATNADTRWQDELVLEAIRRGIPAQTQARAHDLPAWRMQRAYDRVHLMIAAQRDPSVRVRRPEHRVKYVFTLTDENATAIEQLALKLLEQPKSYEKLVALHAHISNLAISTTAKHFNIPTSTLRYYAQQIGAQLHTPTRPAREVGNTVSAMD